MDKYQSCSTTDAAVAASEKATGYCRLGECCVIRETKTNARDHRQRSLPITSSARDQTMRKSNAVRKHIWDHHKLLELKLLSTRGWTTNMGGLCTGNRRLLLVGSSGRVGRMIARHWEKNPLKDVDIIMQTRKPVAGLPPGWINWDPSDPPPDFLARGARETVMIVMAGVTPSTGVDFDGNTNIARTCIAAARTLGIRRVIFSSSSAVYGPGSGRPMNEEQPLRGANAYGRSKIEMESAIAAEGTDIEHCIMRIGNVLGADALLTSAMSLKRGESLMIDKFGSGGGPVRSYIDPVALASVLSSLAFASSTLPRVLNVACPMPSSMVEIAEAAGLRWEWKTAPLSAHEVITLDCSKLQKIHEFSEHDSDPTEMVKRLKSTGYFK